VGPGQSSRGSGRGLHPERLTERQSGLVADLFTVGAGIDCIAIGVPGDTRCRKETMALLRRCLLELRARHGDYDSHQQLGCVSSFDLLSDATLDYESDTGSAPSSDPDFSTPRRPAERKHEKADVLIDAVQMNGEEALMHNAPLSGRSRHVLTTELESHMLARTFHDKPAATTPAPARHGSTC
jgi:hypothetical protein